MLTNYIRTQAQKNSGTGLKGEDNQLLQWRAPQQTFSQRLVVCTYEAFRQTSLALFFVSVFILIILEGLSLVSDGSLLKTPETLMALTVVAGLCIAIFLSAVFSEFMALFTATFTITEDEIVIANNQGVVRLKYDEIKKVECCQASDQYAVKLHFSGRGTKRIPLTDQKMIEQFSAIMTEHGVVVE